MDLVVTAGAYRFDEGDSEVNGDAIQDGTIVSRTGGVETTTSYFTDSFGNTVTGANPLAVDLTCHGNGVAGVGDGVGGTAMADVPNFNLDDSDFFADTDLGDVGQTTPLTITNNSASRAYRVSLGLDYSHTVFADEDGVDGFAESDLELLINGNTVFEAEAISDSVQGNSINKVPEPDFGGLATDTGRFTVDIVVAPGESITIGLDYTLEGGDFDPLLDPFTGAVSGVGEYFLALDNVVAVPEPGGLVFGFWGGLALLSRKRLRRHARNSASNVSERCHLSAE